MQMFVLHMKQLCLPVDILHTQCPCRFVILFVREIQALRSQTPTQRYNIAMQLQESRQRNAIPSYWIRKARHTHTSNPVTSMVSIETETVTVVVPCLQPWAAGAVVKSVSRPLALVELRTAWGAVLQEDAGTDRRGCRL